MSASVSVIFPEATTSSSMFPTFNRIFDALGKAYGLIPRDSQLELAAIVRDTLASGGVCCVEAPTGTGKTLGYLAGALEAQAKSDSPVPIVVATATVGLQSQIMNYDIPRLEGVGAIDRRKVVVAKGRGRYFCPRTAEILEDKQMQDSQLDMFESGEKLGQKGVTISLDMLHAWREGTWSGDKDDWGKELPDCWDAYCGASNDTCVGRACAYSENCPYMKSRAKLSQADLIIANHDIVLADLRHRAEGQVNNVIPAKKYVLIVDEAHNLPEKAIGLKQARASLGRTDWLRELVPYGEAAMGVAEVEAAIERLEEVSPTVFGAGAANLEQALEAFHAQLQRDLKFDLSGVHSWGLNGKDAPLQERALDLAGMVCSIVRALERTAKVFAEKAQDAIGSEKGFCLRMLTETYRYAKHAQELHEGLLSFATEDDVVRWAYRDMDGNIYLNTQPLEGAQVLEKLLWSAEIPVALVSATLQVAGSFERFADKSGLPAGAKTKILAPVFDYSRGFLHQPRMNCAPTDSGFEAELSIAIQRCFNTNETAPGTLILFTSRESMHRVTQSLRGPIKEALLVQDSAPLPELIRQHKQNIDEGRRSVLVGLASMAEGLDLPGAYCSHVIITRLPFAVPGDPIEAARREHLGKDWFEKAYLADMLTRLIQSCGRLIRRESDHGVITILDNRLSGRSYSDIAFRALPDFERVIKLEEYFVRAAAMGLDLTHGGVLPLSEKVSGYMKSSSRPDLKVVAKSRREPGAEEPPASAPDTREASVGRPMLASVPTAPARVSVEQLIALREQSDEARESRAPLQCGSTSLYEQMAALMPAKEPEDSVVYLIPGASNPGLPIGTDPKVWATHCLPQAVMLGIRAQNTRAWHHDAPRWEQVLGLRPDLVQFIGVLRNHYDEVPDPLRALLSEDDCWDAINAVFAPIGEAPSTEALFSALGRIEADCISLMLERFELPTLGFLEAMVKCSESLLRGVPLRFSKFA